MLKLEKLEIFSFKMHFKKKKRDPLDFLTLLNTALKQSKFALKHQGSPLSLLCLEEPILVENNSKQLIQRGIKSE